MLRSAVAAIRANLTACVVGACLVLAGGSLTAAYATLSSSAIPIVSTTQDICGRGERSPAARELEQAGQCDRAASANDNPLIGPVAPPSPATPVPGQAGSPGVNGLPGAPGGNGPPGTPGAAGVAGAPGTPGALGLPGAVGAPGAPGAPGAMGGAGVAGEPGPAGAPGLPGKDGRDGANGQDGANGRDGSPASSMTLTYPDGSTVTCSRSGGDDTAPAYACSTPGT